jgi:hypothetical protein
MDDEEILRTFREVADPAVARVSLAITGGMDETGKTLSPSERAKIRKTAITEFELARDEADKAASDLKASRFAAASREFAADVIDPQAKTAMLLEADQLQRGMTKTEAKNKLLPESYRLLGLGQTQQAETYYRAAQLAGAVDTNLGLAIDRSKSEIYPNRISALAKGKIAEQQAIVAWAALQTATVKFATLVDKGPEAAAASIALKLHDAAQARAEGRPLKSAAELGIPFVGDRKPPTYVNMRDGDYLRGVNALTPVDASGRPLSGRNA